MVMVQITAKSGELLMDIGGSRYGPVKAVVVKKFSPYIKDYAITGYAISREQLEDVIKNGPIRIPRNAHFTKVEVGERYIFDAKQMHIKHRVAFLEI